MPDEPLDIAFLEKALKAASERTPHSRRSLAVLTPAEYEAYKDLLEPPLCPHSIGSFGGFDVYLSLPLHKTQ